MNKYAEWIENYKGNIYRKCKEVTEEMQTVFPELKIVKGLVTIIENLKQYQHQWLIDMDGNIIDPTAKQWQHIIEYKAIDENDKDNIPNGRCINCGGWCFGKRQYTCCETCEKENLEVLNRRKYEN